jgi:hypothetical protein
MGMMDATSTSMMYPIHCGSSAFHDVERNCSDVMTATISGSVGR